MEVERLPWSLVQLSRNGIQLGLRMARQIHPLGEVLPEQAVRVLVASALPRALRIAEIDLL
jgi:hypothetical protein